MEIKHNQNRIPTMNNKSLKHSLTRLCWLLIAPCLLVLGATAYGQTLLYQWSFENATGSGASLAVPPAVVDTADGYTGGNMSLFVTNGLTLSTPAGSGVRGNTNAADLGLLNSGTYGIAASALAGGVGNLSNITNFTVSLWFNLSAGVTNFSSINGAAFNARLFCIDTNYNGTGGTAADGNELYFGLAQPSAAGQPLRIQFGVFVPSGQQYALPFGSVGGATPATFTNNWIFISAVYTPAANGTAQIYVGTTNQTAALVATMTGIGAITNEVKTWLSSSNLVEIGNRINGTGNRSLMGAIDDVRLYGSALTLAQLQAIQGVANPPTIISQPVPDVVFPGQSPQFSVTASGSVPLFYQWMRNGTNLLDGGNISGSQSNVLTITGVSAIDVFNNYQVIVSNAENTVTSSQVSLSLTTTNGAYEAAVLTNSPFAFYTFSETGDPSVGNVEAYDSIGVFNGTYGTGGVNDQFGSGALNGANGIAGPQASADGLIGFPDTNTALFAIYQNFPVDSYVTVPPLNLNNGAGTNVLTISAWIKPLGPQAHAVGIIFSRSGTTTAGLDYNATNSDGNLKLGYTWNNEAATYTWDSGLVPTPGIWSLVSLVITPTNSTIYLINANGLQFSTQAHTNVIQKFEGPTLIGNDIANTSGQRNFEGSIDEVAFFNQALTASQMSALYAAASGTVFVPQPPTIATEPVWPSPAYVGESVSATVTSVGGLSYQWQAGLGGVYTNLTDGTNISGSVTPTLTINSLQSINALDYIVMVKNSFGSITSTPPATLTVSPSGPPQSYTLDFGGAPIVEAGGSDWNTVNSWNPDGQAASVSAFSNPGSTYTVVVGARLRTPVLANTVFPGTGTTLALNGDGVFENGTLNAVGELRVKHTGFNPATNYYGHLLLNGGQLHNGDTGLLDIRGRIDVQANSVFYGEVAENRSFQIDAWLTGSGNIFYHDANLTNNGIADFNVTGTTNTFTGQWIVDQGVLLGSGANSLGTNNIIVGQNGLVAAMETLYDLNNTNASLILDTNGQVFLHQNDHFAIVIINGTPLANGIYPFASLKSTYPANFPATWTQQIDSSFNTGSGQIAVGNVVVPPSSPHITGISLSGTTLSLSVTNGTPGGPWTLLQSINVALPLNQWQINTTGSFDDSGTLSTNLPNTATNSQEFYILKVQ
jgi:Concanavalin A-like lectin/glucanases superfamily